MRNTRSRSIVRLAIANRRSGVMMMELLVAAVFTLCIISAFAVCVTTVQKLWRDSRHYQLAVHEVVNQLDRLTSLPEAERREALSRLSVSEDVAQSLDEAILTGEEITDDAGKRILLRMNWRRGGEALPVEMVAWIVPSMETQREVANTNAPAQSNANEAAQLEAKNE